VAEQDTVSKVIFDAVSIDQAVVDLDKTITQIVSAH